MMELYELYPIALTSAILQIILYTVSLLIKYNSIIFTLQCIIIFQLWYFTMITNDYIKYSSSKNKRLTVLDAHKNTFNIHFISLIMLHPFITRVLNIKVIHTLSTLICYITFTLLLIKIFLRILKIELI